MNKKGKPSTLSLFYEIFILALDSLWSHKLRSFLTLLGIIIGIMAVVGMTSLLRGVDQMMTSEVRMLNPSVIFFVKFGGRIISSHKEFMRLMNRPNLTAEDAKAILKNCKSVKRVDILRGGGFPPKIFDLKYRNNVSENIQIIGASEYYPELGTVELDKGRFFTEAEVNHRRNVIVLGYTPAQGLFKWIDPIGKEIKVGNQKYTVIGTFSKTLEGGLDTGADDYAIIPHTTFRKYYADEKDSIIIAVLPLNENLAEEAKDEVTALLRYRHNLKSWQENDFDILTKDSMMELWKDITRALFFGLIGISSVALLVGGVGVMAIMMVSVTERVREIGIRKAIGAKNKDILTQFLLEAIIITSLGGAAGIIIGIIAAVSISSALNLPISIPWWSFVIGVIFSSLVGLFSGIYPAYKAASLDPIEALRYE